MELTTVVVHNSDDAYGYLCTDEKNDYYGYISLSEDVSLELWTSPLKFLRLSGKGSENVKSDVKVQTTKQSIDEVAPRRKTASSQRIRNLYDFSAGSVRHKHLLSHAKEFNLDIFLVVIVQDTWVGQIVGRDDVDFIVRHLYTQSDLVCDESELIPIGTLSWCVHKLHTNVHVKRQKAKDRAKTLPRAKRQATQARQNTPQTLSDYAKDCAIREISTLETELDELKEKQGVITDRIRHLEHIAGIL